MPEDGNGTGFQTIVLLQKKKNQALDEVQKNK
jgi:hypothetical protein